MTALGRGPVERQPSGPLVFIVLDGVGLGLGDSFDAVSSAATPTLDALRASGLRRQLYAHGTAVGLASDADMGNSEVGHNTLGAGRIFDQGAKQVDKALASGEIFRGDWVSLVAQVVSNNSTLHLIGLLSDGNVHSSIEHLFRLIEQAAKDHVHRVRVHVLLDGRDVPDHSATTYIQRLEDLLGELNGREGLDYQIASGGGRMSTTMDRYGADWSIVERGWRAHVLGAATPASSATAAVEAARSSHPGISDQDLPAFSIVDCSSRPIGEIVDGDGVLVFNFRGDRAMEITRAFTEGDEFGYFDRVRRPKVYFVALALYDGDLGLPEHFLVRPETVPLTMSEYLARAKIRQFACAETQKFGHITYFWNGNRADKFDEELECYLEIPSDNVPFQERPEMKSLETAVALVDAIEKDRFQFLRANFAAGDMVGHTADLKATYRAIESIDRAIGPVLEAVRAANGCLVITADHGNAEDMAQRDENGSPLLDARGSVLMKTSHSLNPVEFLIENFDDRRLELREDLPRAGLANVAATLIELLGFVAPHEYEPSLLAWTER